MHQDPESRLAHIDAMRALAALAVLVMHGYGGLSGGGAQSWLGHAVQTLDFGRIGVVLFFAISGFVIPYSLRPNQHPATFWVRRVFRLYPIYWLSLLLAVATAWLFSGHAYSGSQVLANLTMLQNFLHYENIEGVYWTLKLELFFYVFCYCAFLVGLLNAPGFILSVSAGLAAVLLVYLNYWTSPSGWAHHLPGLARFAADAASQAAGGTGDRHPIPGLLNMNWGNFAGYFSVMFLGAALRRWHERAATRPEQGMLLGLLAFWLVAMPVMGLFAYARTRDAGLFSMFGSWALAVALFLLLTFKLPVRSRLLAALGVISYSVYLLHPIVIDSLLSLAWVSALANAWPAPFIALCAVLTMLLATLAYRLLEKPCIDLGRACAYRLDGASARAADATSR